MSEQSSKSRREDAARWLAVIDAVVQAVITIDERGTIATVNPSCLKMFGYREEELIGKNVRILMPSPDSEQHDRYLENHIQTGEKKVIGIGREVTGRRRDGTHFPVHLSIGSYEANEHRGFVGVLQDLSAQRETEIRLAEHAAEATQHRELLERMDRISLAGEMASGIAHEVNQPLSAIATYSRALQHMIADSPTDSKELQETVEKIRTQSHRAGEILRRMRDFVSKNLKTPRPQSLNKVVDEVLSFAELFSRGRRVVVGRRLEENLPLTLCDQVQIQQVILNLLNNALDANPVPAEVKIEIQTFSENGLVQLHVQDNGVGIDRETEAHLFEPFFSNKRTGTGMGLAISRSIIEAHGGKIGFFRNPVRGVTFFIQLPEFKNSGKAGNFKK